MDSVMRYVFAGVVLFHTLIHLMGFMKAFGLAELNQLTEPISRNSGVVWLVTTLLFAGALIAYLLDQRFWWVMAAAAIVLSQVVIVQYWHDAKFGTIFNVVILLPVIVAALGVLPSSFQNVYRSEVVARLQSIGNVAVVSEADIQHLPVSVQNYLRYSGVIGLPQVHNFRALFTGTMTQSVGGRSLNVSTEQHNFFGDNARLFYIESSLFGVPFDGLHKYIDDSASMRIKVASMFTVVDAAGQEMLQSDTVTMLNDMCLLAPATLIDADIKWTDIDAWTADAKFTNSGVSVVATLHFNDVGQLVNFESDDRYMTENGKSYKRYRWSTPVSEYGKYDGMNLPAHAEAVWHLPDGDFAYAMFELGEIEYNVSDFR